MRLTRNNRTILILLGLIGIKTISCIPPIYHTAEVEPGTSLTVGGGYVGYGYYFPSGLGASWDDYEEARGYRFNTVFRYAGGKRFIEMGHPRRVWERTAIILHLGGMATQGEGARGLQSTYDSLDWEFAPWGELAMQYEFLEKPSLAIQVGMFAPFFPTVGIFAGIPIKNREIATVGFKTQWLYIPASFFITLHPIKRLHLYVQTNLTTLVTDEWELQAGLGVDIVNTYGKEKQ